MNSEPTTTPNAFIVRSMELRRHAAPETHHRFARCWRAIGGKAIVEGCFRPRSTRECEFAPHRHQCRDATDCVHPAVYRRADLLEWCPRAHSERFPLVDRIRIIARLRI